MGRGLVIAAASLTLALWGSACGDADRVTVPEPLGEAGSVAAPTAQENDAPVEEAQIRRLLEEFVDGGQSVGVVAGFVRDGERIVVGHGRLSAEDPGAPDGDTVFEIGSVTKVFTSIVLADLELSGDLALDTPVQSLVGDEVRVPVRDGAEITLGHLATHSSGLPRLPDNLAPADWANPYADYTVEHLYEFLAGHKLARDIGEAVEYSNLGYGLLGHVLALREGVDYETLITQRILEPLEMSDTAVELTPPSRERLAPGHDEELQPVPNWDIPTLAGAGSLRSTVNDLLIFLEANLGLRQTPLREAMAHTHVPQVTDPALGMDIGLGWIIADEGDRRFVWHNGATGGYSSFIGFDPQAREGVVVLSNSVISVDGLAYRLLTSDFDE
ncbi:MAG: beta-lactamase family protein [Acidimicrobiia bacterium]|nr:beta-lactamase family protein [Acidimicrobiia bacterium]MYC46022.1 beta-lactamase family protein [Acidimicrobiia bacterium]MYI20524.1 beta-lactamase family protein [Acidimicrobiia bacterium]